MTSLIHPFTIYLIGFLFIFFYQMPIIYQVLDIRDIIVNKIHGISAFMELSLQCKQVISVFLIKLFKNLFI